jgi:hypothetical protein
MVGLNIFMNFRPTVFKLMWSFILTVALYASVNYFSFMPAMLSTIFIACKISTVTNTCIFTFIGTWIGFYIILSLFHRKRLRVSSNMRR